ncbi:hypothetical protein D3C71_1717690 [compost metagenome]
MIHVGKVVDQFPAVGIRGLADNGPVRPAIFNTTSVCRNFLFNNRSLTFVIVPDKQKLVFDHAFPLPNSRFRRDFFAVRNLFAVTAITPLP